MNKFTIIRSSLILLLLLFLTVTLSGCSKTKLAKNFLLEVIDESKLEEENMDYFWDSDELIFGNGTNVMYEPDYIHVISSREGAYISIGIWANDDATRSTVDMWSIDIEYYNIETEVYISLDYYIDNDDESKDFSFNFEEVGKSLGNMELEDFEDILDDLGYYEAKK